MLSDEQMNIVTGPGIAGWEEIERPVGRQPLPDWVVGAHVDWGNGHCGAPRVHLKVHGDVYQWADQRWQKHGTALYMTRHHDGRAKVHHHDGGSSPSTAWRLIDPAPPPHRPAGERPMFLTLAELNAGITEPWEREVRECHAARRAWRAVDPTDYRGSHFDKAMAAARKDLDWLQGRGMFSAEAIIETQAITVTTQQDGYGGSNYFLTMLDGSTHVLRGPWHRGAPDGYVEVTTFDATERPAWRRDRGRPWHKLGGTAGLYVTEDLFLRIVARFAPHAPMARVHHSYGWRVEPFRAEWGMPKFHIYEAERQLAAAKLPAGPNWRVYWDRSECYCGSPCPEVPTYGLEESQ